MCLFPACNEKPYRDGYCIGHAKHFAKPQEKLNPKKIRRFSKKRQKLQREYRKIVSKAMSESIECEVKAPGCMYESNGMHHKQKRSVKNIIKLDNLVRCCANCQTYIEENPVWARNAGMQVSRFKK